LSVVLFGLKAPPDVQRERANAKPLLSGAADPALAQVVCLVRGMPDLLNLIFIGVSQIWCRTNRPRPACPRRYSHQTAN
jgi:hypothetical protein